MMLISVFLGGSVQAEFTSLAIIFCKLNSKTSNSEKNSPVRGAAPESEEEQRSHSHLASLKLVAAVRALSFSVHLKCSI